MTPQQQRTLDFVRQHYAENGRSPTQRQIRDGLGLTSLSGINRQLQALADYGFLKRTGEYSGNYVPVDSNVLELARIPTSDLVAELHRRQVERTIREAGR